MIMMEKVRILMVIGSLDYCNGITSYAMNYYKELVKDKIKIDFAVHYDFSTEYSERILSGICIPIMRNIMKTMGGIIPTATTITTAGTAEKKEKRREKMYSAFG